MANRWGNSGNSDRIYFCGLLNHCSHEIKRCLLLGRKAMTNLDSTLKSRDITLPTKVCQVKAMVFPVVMYERESWTIKKVEGWELMPSNCGPGEDSWESLDSKEIIPVNPKENQSWIFIAKYHIREGSGNPLQYSCLENPMGRGAW